MSNAISVPDVIGYQRQVAEAPNLNALLQQTDSIVRTLGFRWFNMIRGRKPAAIDGRSFLLTTYPQDWIDRLFKDYRHLNDPLHAAASRSIHGLSWDEVEKYVDLTPRQIETLGQARNYGLCNGFTMPLRANGYENAMFSVARKSLPVSPEERLFARLIGGIAFCRAHELVSGDAKLSTPVTLSSRQLECVVLLARGHSDLQIGRELGISPDTVSEYIENARRSYGVKRRFQLAILAVRDSYLSAADVG